MIEGCWAALHYLCSPFPAFLLVLGTVLGIVVGALPGLTGAMLIALTLPLTFGMSYLDAITLLISMYVGSISGGLITATLLRMPGTPASMMTTLDGYPMAQQGQPGRALGWGICASFGGGMISGIFLLLLSEPLAKWSTKLGPFELFTLVLMSLVLIASVSGPSLLKGLFSGFLGMLMTMPGIAPSTGQPRMTFGFTELNNGLKLLPVLIGLFAVSQVISEIIRIDKKTDSIDLKGSRLMMTLGDLRAQFVNLVRSSVIGSWIGILPGIGANIGSVMAYSVAKNSSSHPERFGQGSEEGIVASEAANNATVGGALIPLIAIGIPGSVIDAILLGALIIHGIQPGPLLFQKNPDLVYTIICTFFISNVFMLVFMALTVRNIAQLIKLPASLLLPVVLVFCVVGSYALSNHIFDVWVMLIFGVVGFCMEKTGIPLAPFVIGFVLAPLAESNLSAGLMSSGGSFLPLITRPISFCFLLISIVLFIRSVRVHFQTRSLA